MRNWREWFITLEDETPAYETEDDIRVVSGAGHMGEDNTLRIPKKLPPRCATCKKLVGFDTGMHLMITGQWRVHVSCFAEVLERHYKDGELIDFTNGAIRKIDYDDS